MVVTGRAPKTKVSALIIDDSAKGFPGGESRVLSLVRMETAIQAGEHKVRILPGKLTRVPAVQKRNAYNIAQTNFYYKKNATAWSVFTERQVKYSDRLRRIYLITGFSGGTDLYVTTIVDTAINLPRKGS